MKVSHRWMCGHGGLDAVGYPTVETLSILSLIRVQVSGVTYLLVGEVQSRARKGLVVGTKWTNYVKLPSTLPYTLLTCRF